MKPQPTTAVRRRLQRAVKALAALNADPDLRMPLEGGVRDSLHNTVSALIDRLRRIDATYGGDKP